MTTRVVAEAGPIEFQSFTINNAASITTVAKDLPGKIVALETPAAARGAKWFFQAAREKDGTYARIKADTNSSISITSTTRTQQYFSLQPAVQFGARFLKVEPNSAQGSTVTINVGYVR